VCFYFFGAGGGMGAVNFGNLATEKKKKWAQVLTLRGEKIILSLYFENSFQQVAK